MKKEFITPIIETEMLTPRESIMRRLASGDPDNDVNGYEVIDGGTRPEENDHWNGFGR